MTRLSGSLLWPSRTS